MKEHLIKIATSVTELVQEMPLEERARNVGMGADGTPTAFVDKVAEDAILDYVTAHELELNILSEEAGFIDRGFEDILVIDPVDGTYNSKRGIPFYSVSLAIGKDNLETLTSGLVMNMSTEDVYYAEKGGGAYLNDERLSVTSRENNDRLLATYFGSTAAPKTYEIALKFRKVRVFGSASLDLCAVAAGQADAYYLNVQPHTRRLRVTDVAAGVLILREAGGEAYDLTGNVLDMRFDLDDRSNIIALANRALLEEFL